MMAPTEGGMFTNRFQHRLWLMFLGLFLPGAVFILFSAYQILNKLSEHAEHVVSKLEVEANHRMIFDRLNAAALPLEQGLDRPVQTLNGLARLVEQAWQNRTQLSGPLWQQEALEFNPERTWSQNEVGSPTVLLVQSYLYEQGRIKPEVADLVKASKILNWSMPSLVAQESSLQLLYFVGAEGQSFFRIAPWINIGEACDQTYPGHGENPYWKTYFPGMLDFWHERIEMGEQPGDPLSWVLTTELYIDAATGSPVQTYAYPVVDWQHKKLLGAMCTDVNQDQLNNLIQKVPPGTKGLGLLYNESGQVLSFGDGSHEVFGALFGEESQPLRTLSLKLQEIQGLKGWRQWADSGVYSVRINQKPWQIGVLSLRSRLIWTQAGLTQTKLKVAYLYQNSNVADAISESSEVVQSYRRKLLFRLMMVLGLTLLALAIGLISVTRHVVPNLNDLVSTAKHMMLGDYNQRVKIRSRDEFGILGTAFNELADKMKSSFERNREQTRKLLSEIKNRQELQRDQLRLVKAVENAAESMVITDVNGAIQYVNPAYCEKLGQEPGEMLGQLPRLFEAVQEGEVSASIWEELARGQVWTGQISNRTKSGQNILENHTVSAIRDDRGHIVNYVLVSRDVTHEVMMESRLRQAQKLESIGTLAGGIAHDFNNLLTPILGLSELILLEETEHPATQLAAKEIQDAARKARDLVRQILTFSRDVESPKEPVNVGEEIAEVAKLMRSFLPRTIQLEVKLDFDGWLFLSPSQLHQVLMNLCTNAFQAMEFSGGTLSIKVEAWDPDKYQIFEKRNLRPDLEYLLISVADSGEGIPLEIQERIFDPFFSTKDKGKGTGLGLATVHGIVQSNGGIIWVESSPNQGSCFHLVFPTCEPAIKKKNEPLPVFEKQGDHTVVLVDDEEMVLDFSRIALEKMGFRVFPFSDPRQAKNFIEVRANEFDLMISDQTMPHLTGLQLVALLRECRPETPALLVSGFSKELIGLSEKFPGLNVLSKPFHLKDLASAVQSALFPK